MSPPNWQAIAAALADDLREALGYVPAYFVDKHSIGAALEDYDKAVAVVTSAAVVDLASVQWSDEEQAELRRVYLATTGRGCTVDNKCEACAEAIEEALKLPGGSPLADALHTKSRSLLAARTAPLAEVVLSREDAIEACARAARRAIYGDDAMSHDCLIVAMEHVDQIFSGAQDFRTDVRVAVLTEARRHPVLAGEPALRGKV